jgi:hypothetical protein
MLLGLCPEIFPGMDFFINPTSKFPRGHSNRTHDALSSGHATTRPSGAPSYDKPNAFKEEDSQHIFEALFTLQHLIFELLKEVSDVQFFLELLEHCISLVMDLSIERDASSTPTTVEAMTPILLPSRRN